jgi:hypothetical protein
MRSNQPSVPDSAAGANRRTNPLPASLAVLLIQIVYPIGSLLLILTSNSTSGMLPSFILMQALTFWIASRFSMGTRAFVFLWPVGAIFFGILHLPWLFR